MISEQDLQEDYPWEMDEWLEDMKDPEAFLDHIITCQEDHIDPETEYEYYLEHDGDDPDGYDPLPETCDLDPEEGLTDEIDYQEDNIDPFYCLQIARREEKYLLAWIQLILGRDQEWVSFEKLEYRVHKRQDFDVNDIRYHLHELLAGLAMRLEVASQSTGLCEILYPDISRNGTEPSELPDITYLSKHRYYVYGLTSLIQSCGSLYYQLLRLDRSKKTTE